MNVKKIEDILAVSGLAGLTITFILTAITLFTNNVIFVKIGITIMAVTLIFAMIDLVITFIKDE